MSHLKKKNLFNEIFALLKQLLFISLFLFFLLVPEVEEFWSILIIKQYFAECVFCAGTLANF